MTTDWMNPLNKIRIRKAVLKKAPQVELEDGRMMNLDYAHTKGRVLITPKPTTKHTNSFVPRGFFSIKTIRDNEWLASDA